MTIPVFDELKTLIRLSGVKLSRLARESGVHIKTLRMWVDGRVLMGRVDQMVRVAMVLRQYVTLTETVSKMVRFYGPKCQVIEWRH